jgi:stage II sporulation SpoM-like protein
MNEALNVKQLVLAQGVRDTRLTLAGWQREPLPVLRVWIAYSALIAAGLLAAVWLIASLSTPDQSGTYVVGVSGPVSAADVLETLRRNLTVLAFHATACVAGFIAGNSLPLSAQGRQGLSRHIHEKAGPLAIFFVVAVTAVSLVTQAYVLGHTGATIAAQVGLSPARLMLTLLPHAIPELTAVFLPLAAWLVASRRDDWHHLLAATFVTVAMAIPILITTAVIEAYIWPVLLQSVAG